MDMGSTGYQSISGMQIADKGSGPVDADSDALPDAWE